MNEVVKSKTWIEINQKNLRNNLSQFRNLIGSKRKLMAVVKSNAYGHGLLEVSKIASGNGADWLGVDSIDEALKIKNCGIDLPILVLGYTLKSRLKEACENKFRLTVYNNETIEELGKISDSAGEKINIHIKVETGTSRQGVLEKDIKGLIDLMKKYPKINIEGLSTHYANIEDTTDHSYAKSQLEKFKK